MLKYAEMTCKAKLTSYLQVAMICITLNEQFYYLIYLKLQSVIFVHFIFD